MGSGISSRNEQDWNIPIDVVTKDGSCEWKIWTTSLWCTNNVGTWEFLAHTVPQLRQVGIDGDFFISTLQLQNLALQQQLSRATTIEEAQAIRWPKLE